MPAIEPPAEEFQKLTAAQVEAAIRDEANPDNPIGREVTRLFTAYADLLVEHVKRAGRVPDELHVTLRWPIEDVAMQVFRQTMLEQTGAIANEP